MTATTHPAQPVLDARRRWTVLAVCCLSMFLVGVDTTIVNVGLPAIGSGLGVDTRGLEWIVDAYTLVLASLLISSGALADRFGRRRVFQCGLAVFGAASLLCALAPSAGVLVAARALQGVGASMLSPVALAIVVNSMPDPKERAQAIGIWASVFGLSMAAGPVTGGALLAWLDWRALFWVNAPVIAAALLLSAVYVPESRAPRVRRLDLPGQVLLAVVLAVVVGVLKLRYRRSSRRRCRGPDLSHSLKTGPPPPCDPKLWRHGEPAHPRGRYFHQFPELRVPRSEVTRIQVGRRQASANPS
ncbi:MFS transporter [Streptomyces venezuelae]|uniref:MFS transporter n=1 Tax=Streptomyces sp. B6(2022) TaxID=3404749 RepID=UPI00311D7C0B